MIITSSDVQTNEYKLSDIKLSDFMCAFMKLKTVDYLGFHKFIKEIDYDSGDAEFININYGLELYIIRLDYTQ